jgi:hypothetical protein
MEQQPQMNVDLSKTQAIKTSEGGQIWQAGFLLRKVNRFLTGGDKDMLVPVQVFFDPKTGEICREGLPDNMDFLFDDKEN